MGGDAGRDLLGTGLGPRLGNYIQIRFKGDNYFGRIRQILLYWPRAFLTLLTSSRSDAHIFNPFYTHAGGDTGLFNLFYTHAGGDTGLGDLGEVGELSLFFVNTLLFTVGGCVSM